ncbi:MAG: hypothetical protein U0228_38885 [Myxococcaceae bacterium]
MARLFVALALSLLFSCKDKPAPPPAPVVRPAPVELVGAYHAVACGPVTAVWSGSAEMLKDLPQPAPKRFGVESLAFKFADGTSRGFTTQGQLFFNDWAFDVFSPDCATVVLLSDHYGPFHVVKTSELKDYLLGKVKPVVVAAPAASGATASVHDSLTWVDASTFEFVASCCGGARAFRATTAGEVKQVFEAASAPKGLRRMRAGYEVIP